jgi:GntR family transcriptional repressor for pyruvate dehydrogenase complex
MSVVSSLDLTRIRPAYEQVAMQLRARILDGSMKPGEKLPVEGQLSSTFGVSRTTIREALRILSSQDLVHTVRGVAGGTFVSTVDAEGFIDNMESRLGLMASNRVISTAELVEVRALIEVPGARLAAQRRTDEDLELILIAAEGNRDAELPDDRGRYSREFHMGVVRAAHNVLLTSIAAPIFAVWAQTGLATDDEWSHIDDQHFEIIECLKNGDGDGASRITELHLASMRDEAEADFAADAAQLEGNRERRVASGR